MKMKASESTRDLESAQGAAVSLESELTKVKTEKVRGGRERNHPPYPPYAVEWDSKAAVNLLV